MNSVLKPFRFGLQVAQPLAQSDWLQQAQLAEASGYDILLMPDHLREQFSPVPALASALQATTTIRMGTFVACNDFRHPIMLAKEMATIDVLSGGRCEIGIGAGWMRKEYDLAGLPFEPPRVRYEKLVEAICIIKQFFAGERILFEGEHYIVRGLQGSPRAIQQPHPPLLIGAGGKKMLALAAAEADIVSLNPTAKDGSLDYKDITARAVARKISQIKAAAGERFADITLNISVLRFAITTEPRPFLEEYAKRFGLSEDDIANSPFVLVGDVDTIVEKLMHRRAQYGLSYFTIPERYLDSFLPILQHFVRHSRQ